MSRIITAPSCNGVFFSKILIRSWDVTIPSTAIPVCSYSPSPTSCSTTINAPVFTAAICSMASAICLTVSFDTLSAPSSLLRIEKSPPCPNLSNAFRISGWKIMTTANTPYTIVFCRSQDVIFMRSMEAAKATTTSNTTPLNSVQALVIRNHTRIWYTRNATNRISKRSIHPNFGIKVIPVLVCIHSTT